MKRALSVWLMSFSLDVLRRQDRRHAGSPEQAPAATPTPATPIRGPAASRGARRAKSAPISAPTPILMAVQDGQRRIVAACCDSATRAGVRPGMPIAQARAIFPRDPRGSDEPVRIVSADPDLDQRVLRALAGWALRFSPLVAAEPPDGLRIDISGCQAVLGGEARITHLVIDGLARLGFHARVAIASTHACAWAAARFGGKWQGDKVAKWQSATEKDRPPPLGAVEGGSASTQPTAHTNSLIIPDGSERRVLAPLPVAALRIDTFTIAGLAEVGVTTIGQVLDLPRAALHARFGRGARGTERGAASTANKAKPDDADLLLRLDQALGQAMEPLHPIRPHNPLRVERVFDGPTTRTEAIELATRGLLDAACLLLQQRESGARVLEITLARADLSPEQLRISLSRPTRDPRHLWSLIRPKLERVELGFGVEGVSIHVPWLGRFRHTEPGFRTAPSSLGASTGGAGTQPAAGQWPATDSHDVDAAGAELIDTLAARIGRDGVLRAGLIESHLPERAAALRSCAGDASRPSRTAACPEGDRPSLLLPRPKPVDVIALTPDGPVLSIRIGDRTHRAEMCIGPHRLAPEWWRTGSAPDETRDYFKLQDQHGRWLWLFRTLERGKWYLHGEWL